MSNGSTAEGQAHSAVRGLATVAMLKANFDAGRDHIAMFGPFVLDAVASISRPDIAAEEVCKAMRQRHQLAIPLNTMKTLLGRMVKDGYLIREGGRYFRSEKQIDSDDVPRRRAAIEDRQRVLAAEFRASRHAEKLGLRDDEEALGAILRFLERYHVDLALADGSPPLREEHLDQGDGNAEVATALFLRAVITAEGESFEILGEMLEGWVLQSTLLLKDVSATTRKFKDLRVAFDSRLLFSALGLQGDDLERSTLELVGLLRDTGAVLEVFEPTIGEMRRILAVYEEKIGTTKGRLELYPTDLTRHLISKRYQPSDVRQIAGLLEANIRKAGFNLREIPDRVAEFTMDEADLSKRLAAEDGNEKSARVVHDVDCIAAILTQRQNRASDSLDNAGAVFVSDSGSTVRTVREWYLAQEGRGCGPIIHVLTLSNFAWLKRPASASKLKVHELMALCSAALRPTPEAWQHFIDHLRRLEAEGELNDEEITAIVASELTENLLAERGIDAESDATSLTEVVERVKSGYEEDRAAAKNETREIRDHVHHGAEQVARVATWAAVLILGMCFLVGAAIGVLGGTASVLVIALTVVPLAAFGLLSLWNGWSLREWRSRAEVRLTQRLDEWFTGRSLDNG
jgi:hypothetical protein